MKRILFVLALLLLSIAASFGAVQEFMNPDLVTPGKVSTVNPLPVRLMGSGTGTATGTSISVTIVNGTATNPLPTVATITYNVSSYTNFVLTPNVAYVIASISNQSFLGVYNSNTTGEFWGGAGTTTITVGSGTKYYSSMVLRDMNLASIPVSIIASTALNISTQKLSR